jgi:hypothetical protein
MKHVDEGTIVAIRDGALVTGDARQHVDTCSECARALAEARRRGASIEAALAPRPETLDVERAKRRVRNRLDARRGERPRRRFLLPLGRAAALLLVAGGAAYALPGSPVRDWVRGPGPDPEPIVAAMDQEALAGGGIAVPMPEDGIRVSLGSVTAGAAVELVWVDEPVARIYAAEGTSYSFAEGHAEATVAPGPVRVEVFRSAPSVSLRVNGRMIFEGSADVPRLLESALVRDQDRVVFTLLDGNE